MTSQPLLQVHGLGVDFTTSQGNVHAVADVAFDVRAGECLAVVGESGSGKTQVLMACLGLLASNGTARGSVRFAGQELLGATERTLNTVRGTGIGFLSQDPLSSLTPHLRIETVLTEGLLDRGLATRSHARELALQALIDVDLPEPESRLRQYPHELSGGMRQRVALAAALMCSPQLLFADEPTTALDVSVQARVLELLAKVRDRGVGVLIITHDLGVVAGLADRVAVMYCGRIVETATTDELFAAPKHPYSAALLASVPRLHGDAQARLVGIPGDPPQPSARPPGCAFAPRCERAVEQCSESRPELTPWMGPNSFSTSQGGSTAPLAQPGGPPAAVACHRPLYPPAEIT